jgi:hypothetical protein
VCTYATELVALSGSAKGPRGWFSASSASVYVDHPVHNPHGHALLIDVLNPELGPDSRVALELDADAARALATAILRALNGAPEGLLDGLGHTSGVR